MAETKPDRVARWATDADRTVEPSSGQKDTGWEVNKKPPPRFMNWLQNFAYRWFAWLNERMFDGATANDLEVTGVDVTAGTDQDGGDVELSGGSSTGSGSSQAVVKAAVAGSAGSDIRTPTEFLIADGNIDRLVAPRAIEKIVVNPTTPDTDAITATGNGAGSGVKATGGSTGPAVEAIGTSSAPVLDELHSSSATNTLQPLAKLKAKTSADMAEGYGAKVNFVIEDDTSGELEFGVIESYRGPSDASYKMRIRAKAAANPGIYLDELRVAIGAYVGTEVLDHGGLIIKGDVHPDVDNNYDLGRDDYRWSRVYANEFMMETGYIEGSERSDPAAPAANRGRIYFRDNGGKTELVVRFPTGAIQQIAIEP